MSEDQELRHKWNCALFELQMKRRELDEAIKEKKELQEELESLTQREVELLKKIEDMRNLRLTKEMSLKGEPEELREKAAQIKLEIGRYSVYKDILDEVVKYNQFEDTDAMVNHYEKLLYVREKIRAREAERQEKRSQQRKTLQELEERRQFLLMQHEVEMSKLQAELDRTRAEADGWERKLNRSRETATKQAVELSRVRMATLNMYEKTGGKVGGADGVDMYDTEKQLDKIKVFVLKNNEILKEYQKSLRKDEKKKQETTRKPVKGKGKKA